LFLRVAVSTTKHQPRIVQQLPISLAAERSICENVLVMRCPRKSARTSRQAQVALPAWHLERRTLPERKGGATAKVIVA
jgi:hypothetical protein